MYRFNYDASANQHQLHAEEDGDKDQGTEDEYGDEEFERHDIQSDADNISR